METSNYNTAKFLVKILNPLATIEYTVKDTFIFVNELSFIFHEHSTYQYFRRYL